MKSIACLLFALLNVSTAWSQSSAEDNSFRSQLTKTIRNPVVRNLASKTTNVYVDFIINPAGKIGEVKVMNADQRPAPYVTEITRAMNQLPVQKGMTAGEYVLPVVFETTGETKYTPNPAVRPQVHQYFIQMLHSRKLLDEIFIAANE